MAKGDRDTVVGKRFAQQLQDARAARFYFIYPSEIQNNGLAPTRECLDVSAHSVSGAKKNIAAEFDDAYLSAMLAKKCRLFAPANFK